MITFEKQQDGILVKDDESPAQKFYTNDEIIQNWRGDYDDGVTVAEALSNGTLRIAQDGMMRGTPYHE